MNNIGELERQREHFNSIAEKYYNSRQDPRHLHLKKKIWENFFSDLALPDKEHLIVLEAMCGYAEAYSISLEYIKKKFLLVPLIIPILWLIMSVKNTQIWTYKCRT